MLLGDFEITASNCILRIFSVYYLNLIIKVSVETETRIFVGCRNHIGFDGFNCKEGVAGSRKKDKAPLTTAPYLFVMIFVLKFGSRKERERSNSPNISIHAFGTRKYCILKRLKSTHQNCSNQERPNYQPVGQ